MRGDILRWFVDNAGTRALIGGDLNSSLASLDAGFQHQDDVHYCYEHDCFHGDVMIAKGLPSAESMACDIVSTSKAHRMCIVQVRVGSLGNLATTSKASGTAAKPPSAKAVRFSFEASGSADKPVPTAEEEESFQKEDGARWKTSENERPKEHKFSEPTIEESDSGEEENRSMESRSWKAMEQESRLGQKRKNLHGNANEPVPAPSPPVHVEEEYPLAAKVFRLIGSQMDAGEAERQLLGKFMNHLWTGDYLTESSERTVPRPRASKARLNRLLTKALEVRQRYHSQLWDDNEIEDRNFDRSLTAYETTKVHNRWMNDVDYWMSPGCLEEYNEYIRQADELENKPLPLPSNGWDHYHSQARVKLWDHNQWQGKGSDWHQWGPWGAKGKSSAAKSASWYQKGGYGKAKSSAGEPANEGEKEGLKQKAQQLKKQRFNKVVSDLAANKSFFRCFVRHPSCITFDGILRLLEDLQNLKASPAYAKMVEVSEKKSEEVARLKRDRDKARLAVKRGKREYEQKAQTSLAKLYASGDLLLKQELAETAYGYRKSSGVGASLSTVPWLLR